MTVHDQATAARTAAHALAKAPRAYKDAALHAMADALATRATRPGLYTGLDAQIRREIGWSLASAAIPTVVS